MIVSMEQVLWADMIFVMERVHKARLSKKFGTSLKSKQIICLDIPDKYTFMQPELITILERTAGKYLRRNQH
ncbi:hypothetical protein SAMN04487926_1286 [Paraburkholderia steynii]|uniref:Protein-tyrosine-phosphatase n=2 Tax=Paraburkholderia steynii TaxID=1245441 RepID=A0A7Z7FMQ2_9BURK|nr:hypothetical protein SAMN04487926_1286 [Paraburkholderia steynii]